MRLLIMQVVAMHLLLTLLQVLAASAHWGLPQPQPVLVTTHVFQMQELHRPMQPATTPVAVMLWRSMRRLVLGVCEPSELQLPLRRQATTIIQSRSSWQPQMKLLPLQPAWRR